MAQLRSRFGVVCGEAGGADGRCGGTGGEAGGADGRSGGACGEAGQEGRGLATVGRFSVTLNIRFFFVTLNIRYFSVTSCVYNVFKNAFLQ